MATYLIPAARVRHEIEVKRSRFIATLARASSRLEADAFIAERRQEFPGATHNCFAYIAGLPGSTGDVACSDDGEVSGTAGRPMLNLLQHSGLAEVVAVVTRYYGGTLLGSGGLVRAYSQVLKEALSQLPVQACVATVDVVLEFEFAIEATVRRELARVGAQVLQQGYAERVRMQIQLPVTMVATLRETLTGVSKGQLLWQESEA